MPRPKKLLLSADLRVALGVCLRNLREIKKPELSAAKVAKELGVSPATLCEIEKGRSEPSLALIHIAAKFFTVHPNVILGVAHMKEFDFDSPLDAEAIGLIRLQDVLPPDVIVTLRDQLQRLGYQQI